VVTKCDLVKEVELAKIVKGIEEELRFITDREITGAGHEVQVCSGREGRVKRGGGGGGDGRG